MAEKKEEPKPFFTTEKVALYAPKGAKHYNHGQKIEVQARQKDKFLKLGFVENEADVKDAEAHPAISVPVAKSKPGRKTAGEGENAGAE